MRAGALEGGRRLLCVLLPGGNGRPVREGAPRPSWKGRGAHQQRANVPRELVSSNSTVSAAALSASPNLKSMADTEPSS